MRIILGPFLTLDNNSSLKEEDKDLVSCPEIQIIALFIGLSHRGG